MWCAADEEGKVEINEALDNANVHVLHILYINEPFPLSQLHACAVYYTIMG